VPKEDRSGVVDQDRYTDEKGDRGEEGKAKEGTDQVDRPFGRVLDRAVPTCEELDEGAVTLPDHDGVVASDDL
jgi:hypothetical protein